jgi:serine/threonine protein kinase
MHRNLKPDNIMFSENGVLKITDFALSRIAVIPHFSYPRRSEGKREIRKRGPQALVPSS